MCTHRRDKAAAQAPLAVNHELELLLAAAAHAPEPAYQEGNTTGRHDGMLHEAAAAADQYSLGPSHLSLQWDACICSGTSLHPCIEGLQTRLQTEKDLVIVCSFLFNGLLHLPCSLHCFLNALLVSGLGSCHAPELFSGLCMFVLLPAMLPHFELRSPACLWLEAVRSVAPAGRGAWQGGA